MGVRSHATKDIAPVSANLEWHDTYNVCRKQSKFSTKSEHVNAQDTEKTAIQIVDII